MPFLSRKSAFIYSVIGICCAFVAGRVTSIFLIGTTMLDNHSGVDSNTGMHIFPIRPLKHTYVEHAKKIPKTKYTSMIYTNDIVITSSTFMTSAGGKDSFQEYDDKVCVRTDEGHSKCATEGFKEEHIEEFYQGQLDNSKIEHLPAGQHIIVDIERVNSEFLNSEISLAEAIVQLVNESNVTLLSHHCHKLVPLGISCAGVLLESHISLHTWPEAGVITLDLFTCGSGKLINVLPIVKTLFAIPMDGASDTMNESPKFLWSLKMRGFQQVQQKSSYHMGTDLMDTVLEASNLDYKEAVATSVQTPFQVIDIYDVLEMDHAYQSYEKSLLEGDTYESRNPSFFRPNRIVFLDGVIQSDFESNEAYHEALVHPAMFLHPDPKRVAIIGGGECATLREVLKHKTVDEVHMIEIDEMMVNTSRTFLPDWNNCSDFVGGSSWCGDDERVHMHYMDAVTWFDDRFSEDAKISEEKFDVLIMDALDPEDDVPFAQMLYSDHDFIETLSDSLTEDGIIVLQLGEAPFNDEPAAQFLKRNTREHLIELLEDVGAESMHFYEEGNCGFDAPWYFLVAAMDDDIDSRWYMTEAALEVDIHKRITRTVSGEPPLKYFDGSIKNGYHYPHKGAETVFCRTIPTPDSCQEKAVENDSSSRPNMQLSEFEVKMSKIGDGSGRGIFALVDIQEGTSIGRKENSHPLHAKDATMKLVRKYNQKDLFDYLEGYGWDTETFGGNEYYVDSSYMTFVNHGCNATFNILELDAYLDFIHGVDTIYTELNVTAADNKAWRDEVYDLYEDRHIEHSALAYPVALRDIKAGEEILSNYVFYATGADWLKDVEDLKRLCSGEEVGLITKVENKQQA